MKKTNMNRNSISNILCRDRCEARGDKEAEGGKVTHANMKIKKQKYEEKTKAQM